MYQIFTTIDGKLVIEKSLQEQIEWLKYQQQWDDYVYLNLKYNKTLIALEQQTTNPKSGNTEFSYFTDDKKLIRIITTDKNSVKIKQTDYIHDFQFKIITTYKPDGDLKSFKIFDHRDKVFAKSEYSKSKLLVYGVFKNPYLHGKQLKFWPSGKLKSIINYNQGRILGVEKHYNNLGQPTLEKYNFSNKYEYEDWHNWYEIHWTYDKNQNPTKTYYYDKELITDWKLLTIIESFEQFREYINDEIYSTKAKDWNKLEKLITQYNNKRADLEKNLYSLLLLKFDECY